MKIQEIIDLKRLQTIQDMFAKATGLAAIAVDAEGKYITKGSGFTDFCMRYTRGSQLGAERCHKCDVEGKGAYTCHAGLMDFGHDIIVEGEKVGAILGGQVLPQKPDDEKFRAIARELKIDEEAYLRAVHKVPIRNTDEIHAAVALLGETINNFVNVEYFKKLNAAKKQVMAHEMKDAMDAVDTIIEHIGNLETVSVKQKMLAFNASIEAARAGQAGAVFTVVANEMQTLSSESVETYAEIKQNAEQVALNVHKVNEALQ